MHDVVAVLQGSRTSSLAFKQFGAAFHLGVLRILDLDPGTAAAMLAAGFPLRHNSLEIQLAGVCEQSRAVLLEVVQVQNMPNCPRTDEPPQALLSLKWLSPAVAGTGYRPGSGCAAASRKVSAAV